MPGHGNYDRLRHIGRLNTDGLHNRAGLHDRAACQLSLSVCCAALRCAVLRYAVLRCAALCSAPHAVPVAQLAFEERTVS